MLTVTSFEMEASGNDSSFSLAHGQLSSGSSVSHCDSAACSGVTTGTEDYSDIMTNWWCTSDCNVTDSVSNSYSSQSTDIRPVKNLTKDLAEDMEDDAMCEKFDKFAVESTYEQLRDSNKHTLSEENQCKKIIFADDKLRLIYKQMLSSQMTFRAEVHVQLDKHFVKISGTADDVRHTEMKLHEIVISFVTSRVGISETSAKMLSTKIGEDWLDAHLANEQLVAVFHVNDTAPMITTDCWNSFVRIKHMLESSLVVRYKLMEQHHIWLIQSDVWSECIVNLQSTLLLRISVDYGADIKLVIEGFVDDVEVALDKLGKMLGENSRISHNMNLRRGVYLVLCFRRSEIQQEAKYVDILYMTVNC